MCSSGAFFPPTGLPPIALLGTGALLCLAVLGSVLWLATHWLNQHQALAFPVGFSSRETFRGYAEYARGYRSSEPKQEYEQPSMQLPQEMPPQW